MIFSKRHKTELSYVLYEVTEQCNLNCIFCYNHWKREGSVADKNDVDYAGSLKTLKKLFSAASVKHVTFTGGEPMLAERIGELILFCRMKGATVSLITNGNNGSFEELSQLINIGVQLFELPVHSAQKAIHDQMTGVKGSWERSVNTIRYISRMGGNVVPVVVVTKYNYHVVGETLSLIHSMGFNRIMLNRYNIGGRGVDFPEKVATTREELNEAFGQANETARKLGLTVSSNVCTPHCVVDPRLYRNIRFSNCSPDVAHRPLTLTTKGELRFCNHSPSVLGNIYNETIESILQNGQSFASVSNRPEYCSDCSLYEKCLGGCRAAAEQAGGTFGQVDPIVFYKRDQKETKTA